MTATVGSEWIRAAALRRGSREEAFGELPDKAGSVRLFDTHVFVDAPDGTELMNPAQPSMGGKNVLGPTDVNGRRVTEEYIAAGP